MILGVDYYPEHWPETMIAEDIERMKTAGVNTVRIGEFAWHLMEPTEGQYDFSYFDHVVQLLKAADIHIIFGTPTATFPAWLAKRHPEIIATTAFGIQHAFGGRRLYCYNIDVYREKAKAITKALVTHYRDEKAIIAWQIDNEIGHEGSDQCYCKTCHHVFHDFLMTKYGHIHALNEAYGTVFWGQTYNDFEEVPMPTPTITQHNPGLALDWARFRSESIYQYVDGLTNVVRQHCGKHQRVLHNLYGGYFDRAFDQVRFSEVFDMIGYDHYPVWGGLKAPISPAHITMALSYMRGLKHRPFWVVEAIMGAQGHDYIGYMPRENQALMWSLHALAHGSEALLYFRWRGMTHGAEQFCQGILDADNRDNQKLNEVITCFKLANTNESVLTTPIEAAVALCYDYDNRWSWHAQPQSDALNYTDLLAHYYNAFYRHNTFVDVRSINAVMTGTFSDYRILVMPIMQIVDDQMLQWLKRFVENGGILITGFRSGIKGRHNQLLFGSNAFAAFCGIQVEGFESLGAGLSCPVICDEDRQTTEFGTIGRDLIVPVSASALWHYGDTGFEQYAALTVQTHGKGAVYYLGTCFAETIMLNLAERVLGAQGIKSRKTPAGLECIQKGDATVWVNHNHENTCFEDKCFSPYEVRFETVDANE
ncbi:MAG: beta-galactosidase [Clostridiales bacterium]|jgi:beta-galactosidase|nr:beta-galactosidase [Clostridiales bacterium]